MEKWLKYVGVLIILGILTATVVRWSMIFLITASLTPSFLILRIVEINFQNLATAFTFKFPFLHINIYPMPFPLVFMNPNFAPYYKNFRFLLICLANIISLLFYAWLIYKLSPPKIKKNLMQIRARLTDYKHPVFFKRLKIGLATLLIVIILILYFVIRPVFGIYQIAKDINYLVKQTVPLVKSQDYPAIKQNLEIIKNKLALSRQYYKNLGFIGSVPIAKNYYYDVESLLLSTEDILNIADSVLQFLPKLKLTSLQEINDLNPMIDSILNNVARVKEKTDRINPDRYPESLAGQPLRERIITIKGIMAEIDNDRSNVSQLAKIAPDILGFNSPKNYLVLFQDENEIKPTGGTLVAYGIFRFDKGKILPQGSYEIFNQNINDSPDFYQSMEKFRQANPGVYVNGIIALDGQMIASVLDVIGPVPVFGQVLSAEKNSTCNCPRVFNDIDNMIKTNKKEVIGIVLNAVLLKTQSSPSGVLPDLGLSLWQSIKEKHLLFYLTDKENQKYIDGAQISGRLTDFQGDYLFINETNISGVKEDRFLKRSIEEKIDISEKGVVTKTLVLTYQKTPPSLSASKLNLRLYVNQGAVLTDNHENSIFVTTQDLGKTVFETQIEVKTQVGKKLSIRYQLPFTVKPNNEYSLLRQKQPGINEIEFTLYLNGQKKENFFLTYDRQLILRGF